MNIRNYGLSMALIATVVVPWMISGCDQVTTQCQVGKATAAGYAAVYKLISSTGDCSASPLPLGETIGLDDYHPVEGMTRNFTKADVYIQVGSLYDTQQEAQNCYSPADPSVGYKGGNFGDTTDTVWSVGNFKDFLPDSSDFCYVDGLTTAQQHIPSIPATKAGTNPPGLCFSPAEPAGAGAVPYPGAAPCDNQDGTFSNACVCQAADNPACTGCGAFGCDKKGMCLTTCASVDDCAKGNVCDAASGACVTNCCDKFYSYCADTFDACTADKDCCGNPKDKGYAKCIAHDAGLCTQTPVTICAAPDPNTGLAVGCLNDADCAVTGAKCGTPAAAAFCVNKPSIIGCFSDDDCCDPADPKYQQCLMGTHTCLPGGVDFTSCHTNTLPAQDISFQWSNVKLYNTASAPGTQMTATVDRTTGTCQQKYQVLAVWPSIGCDDGTGKPFPPACCPGSDAKDGIPLGSGINPNFAVKCDPQLLLCVLDIAQVDKDGTPTIPQLDAKGYPDICPKPESIPDGQ